MTKIKHIAITLFCILAVASCSKDHIGGEPSPEQVYAPLKLNVKLGDVAQNASQNVASRAAAITGVAFGEGTELGMVLVDKDPSITRSRYGTSAPYRCKVDYTDPDAPVFSWAASEADKQLMVNVSPAIALAHYPAKLPAHATLNSDKRSMSIELPNTMDYGSRGGYDGSNIAQIELKTGEGKQHIYFAPASLDFMTGAGKQELTAVNDVVQTDIVMQHAMAMVVVRFTSEAGAPNHSDFIGGLSVQSVATTGEVLFNGTFALADNSFTHNTSKPVKYDRPMSGFLQGTHFGMFVFPASFDAGKVKIVAKVGAVAYTFTLPETKWVSGTIYLYDINLKHATGMLGGPVVIKGWAAKNENVELD